MPETPTAAELKIPPASIAAWCEGPDINCGNDEHDIRAVAAPVVAAELRRIADESAQELERAVAQHDLAQDKSDQRAADMWFGKAAALDAEVSRLIARAAVLDPPSRQEDCR